MPLARAYIMAGMACGRTADGQQDAVAIRPWVMKAVAAAGLPVDRSYIICRDIVDGVEELRAFVDEGITVIAQQKPTVNLKAKDKVEEL